MDQRLVGAVSMRAAPHGELARLRHEAAVVVSRGERILADFFDNAVVGLHWVGADGTILRANRAELNLLGYCEEEYVGHPIAQFHADQSVIDDILARLTRGEELREYEARLRAKDGSIKHVLIDSNVFWEDGRFMHTRCFTRDITDRKRSEHLLVEQKQLLEMIALAQPIETVFAALTDAASRLQPQARAAVLLADDARAKMGLVFAARLPAAFGQAMRGLPTNDGAIGTCGTAIVTGQPVTCVDIARDDRWSPAWEDLCATHGIHACHSTPVFGPDGAPVASFMICFDTERVPDEWERRLGEFGAHIAGIAIERDRARKVLETELRDSKLLQTVSAALVHEHEFSVLFDKFVDTAVTIMNAQFATMQALHPERGPTGELQLLAQRGFTPQAGRFWEWVNADSNCTCGVALRTGKRCVAPDVEHCDFMAGTSDQQMYLQAGIRAGQSTPLFSRGGKLLGMISTHWDRPHEPSERELRLFDVLVRQAADLIERMRVEEDLRDADRRKDEFLAMLAHELRNPLAPIRNATEIMRLIGDNAEVVEAARQTIERQLNHLTRLVDDLLDVSRITRNKIELRKERLTLASIVQSAIETSRPLIVACAQELKLTMPEQTIWVNADLTRMAQVVANLLNNAAKYTPRGGRIELTVSESRGARSIEAANDANGHTRQAGEPDLHEAVIQVRDTGIGVPAEMLPHIFEMFRQVDASRERSQGGLGIGLTLVKSLVELHGGSVSAASAGEGQGSEFTVRLPLACDEPCFGAGREGLAVGSETKPPGRRILVADDNRDAAVTLSALLRVMGHQVATAHDGPAALEQAAVFRPDVAMLDIGMPGMSGCEVASSLRQKPELDGLVLIAVTGWGQDEDRRRSKEAGFDHHLVKPVAFQDLQRLLTRLQPTVAQS